MANISASLCASGPGEARCQQPEGRHQQTEVSDRGVSRGAEEPDGEDEGECEEHEELHREWRTSLTPKAAALMCL